jgi:hypothetical protein
MSRPLEDVPARWDGDEDAIAPIREISSSGSSFMPKGIRRRPSVSNVR